MPNLVFIMSDEARKDVVFHEKYPFVRTPNIDALRGEAVSFHHCFANYPVCVPSRSSVITGRYPHQIGVLRNTVTACRPASAISATICPPTASTASRSARPTTPITDSAR